MRGTCLVYLQWSTDQYLIFFFSFVNSSVVCKGASAPPLSGFVLPAPKDPEVKKYAARVPEGKGGGDKMTLEIHGEEITITIPTHFASPQGGTRKIRPGDRFTFEWGHRDKVIASTLPSLPGATIVEAKPIIFSSVSLDFYDNSCEYT